MANHQEIDSLNYSTKSIPIGKGHPVRGLTVRALIKILQNMDPDNIVAYMDSQGDQLYLGEIAGSTRAGEVVILCSERLAVGLIAQEDP